MSPSAKPVIRLRGHHLICLHFFQGEGYGPEYVRNLTQILEDAQSGGKIEIAKGADDVCRKCPSLKGGRCLYSPNADDEIRDMDEAALRLLGLSETAGGIAPSWPAIRDRIPSFFAEWSARYCGVCSWRSVCERQKEFRRLTE